jgi:dolichol-phosphate mannosyltransferase
MLQLSVIVPTYCEAENLPVLVPRICDAAEGRGIELEIIVVDDNSPDDTVAVCRQLGETYPLQLLLRKHERGLSSAVIAGMRAARGKLLLVMDADLSHPAEKIPELVSALDDPQVDFVIGSRYAPGGTTADDWGWGRRLNSLLATLLARPLTSARDPMAGFFCLRTTTFEAAAPVLNPIGYKIGLELIVKCRCRSVLEIPICFTDRVRGDSKMSLREQVNYLRHLLRLFQFRYRNLTLFLQFALVGASGIVVDLTLFAMLLKALSAPVAGALAIWAAMTWNFTWNRRWTFSYASTGSLLRQYVGFCGGCLLGAVLNWSTRVSLIEYAAFFEKHPLLAALVGVSVGMVSNFVLCRFVVFRKPAEPPASHGPDAAETGAYTAETSPTTVDVSEIDQESSGNTIAD